MHSRQTVPRSNKKGSSFVVAPCCDRVHFAVLTKCTCSLVCWGPCGTKVSAHGLHSEYVTFEVIQVCFAQTAALGGFCAEGWATGEETYGVSEWRSRRKWCSHYNIATDRTFRECNHFHAKPMKSDALAPTKPIQSASLEPSWPKIAPNIGLLWFFVDLGCHFGGRKW